MQAGGAWSWKLPHAPLESIAGQYAKQRQGNSNQKRETGLETKYGSVRRRSTENFDGVRHKGSVIGRDRPILEVFAVF